MQITARDLMLSRTNDMIRRAHYHADQGNTHYVQLLVQEAMDLAQTVHLGEPLLVVKPVQS